MVIEFSISDYRSFKDLQTLSFKATGLVSEEKHKSLDQDNIVEIDGNRILKTIGLYGPNGSGKSNLLKGLAFMQHMVSNSLDTEGILKRYRDFFKLAVNYEPSSFFQIVLLIEGKKYRYGFTIGHDENIKSEWLFGPADKKETYYFKRNEQDIEINGERFAEGEAIPRERLRKDALFLSFVSSYDGAISGSIRSYIINNIVIDSQSRLMSDIGAYRRNVQTNLLVESGQKSIIIDRMQDAGIYYTDLSIEKLEYQKDDYFQFVYFMKNTFNDSGEVAGKAMFWLDEESSGTRKYYDYIGVFNKLFQEGGLYISDEIDNNFHPSLLRRIVGQFNNPELNKMGAQLLFSSHDTNLMDPSILRRDQFYFTEKNTMEFTKLYSLADLKGVRNGDNFARQYLAGMYGALPLLHNKIEAEDQITINNQ